MLLEKWVSEQNTPAGIGIDLVLVQELRELDERTGGAFCSRTFSERERSEAEQARDKWVYYAGRFAVKEAVFKAVAHLLPEKTFDFRIIETLHNPDGSPYVVCDGAIRTILDNANVSTLLVSVSNEGEYAAAIVQAVKKAASEQKA